MYQLTLVAFLLTLFFQKTYAFQVCNVCSCKNDTGVGFNILEVKCERLKILNTDLEFPSDPREIWFSYHFANLSSITVKRLMNALPRQYLTRLSLSHNNIEAIQPRLFSNLKNIQFLSMSYNQISNLKLETFIGLHNLKHLSLSNNMLEECNVDVFSQVNLTGLDLSFNKISKLPSNSTLNSLLSLNLSHNTIENISGIENFPKLEELDLSHNYIMNVSILFSMGLSNLKTIDLSHNKLITLGFYSSSLLPQIKSFKLHHNMLIEIALPHTYSTLKELNLNYNQIPSLGFVPQNSSLEILLLSNNTLLNLDNIQNLKNIKVLDLSHNNISSMVEDIPQTLRQLNLSHNIIKTIKKKVNSNIGHLTNLDLSYTQSLTDIEDEAFSGIFADGTGDICTEINLSHCSLSKLHEKTFLGAQLCKVNLEGNHLENIPQNLLDWEKVEVNLQHNPIACECSSQWLVNKMIPLVYNKNQELLDELRCASPAKLKGRRLVHWYNLTSNQAFCDFSDDPTSGKTITMKSSASMIAIFTSLGFLALAFVIVGFWLQRRKVMRIKSRMNRRYNSK